MKPNKMAQQTYKRQPRQEEERVRESYHNFSNFPSVTTAASENTCSAFLCKPKVQAYLLIFFQEPNLNLTKLTSLENT